jgi:hypothetical protein
MLRGRCACKAVGYEVADEFVVAYNCHCSNCRAMTGSAFLPWGEIERGKLRVKRGTDTLLVDGDADAAHAMRCGQCWSLLYWTVHHHDPHVASGALRITHRRANAQADGAHVRRLAGSVVRDPR